MNLSLTEWEESRPVALSNAQRRVLETAFGAVLQTADEHGRWRVRPGGVVGAVEVEDISIVVRPKFPIDRVLFMVAYAADPYQWRHAWASIAGVQDLAVGMARLFTAVAESVLAKGLLRSYRRRRLDLVAPKGRIEWAAHVARPRC